MNLHSMSLSTKNISGIKILKGVFDGGELIDDTTSAITHFRTKNLSIMAAIALSKTDAGSLMALLEEIDSSYSQLVDVRKFSFNYCGDYQETFLVLWVRYISAVLGKKSMFYTLDVDDKKMDDEDDDDNSITPNGGGDDVNKPHGDSGEEKKQEDQDDGDQHTAEHKGSAGVSVDHIFNSTYSHFLQFLIFLMSLPNNECFCWVYWIFFSLPKLQPTPTNLPRLAQLLWGTAEKMRFTRNAAKRKVDTLWLNIQIE